MHTRPPAVIIAAILLALFSLFFSPIVLAVAGIFAASGLWMMKPWSFSATHIVCVLGIFFGVWRLVMGPSGGLQALSAVGTISFVLIIVLVVLPTSRRALAPP